MRERERRGVCIWLVTNISSQTAGLSGGCGGPLSLLKSYLGSSVGTTHTARRISPSAFICLY